MKVAVSLPDELFERADAAAEQLALNRSQLYARALEAYLDGHDDDPVTAALDGLAQETTALDAAAGRLLIDSGAWEW